MTVREIVMPNGDHFRFRPISEYELSTCEPIENVYPTSFMTPEEIEQRNQRREEFKKYLELYLHK
ncbi:MAG TPA: hypothetical protein VMC80_02225 [Patescibacteria group bacterium]|nr:hypothetical protein [Patescibacteria group bacterium]